MDLKPCKLPLPLPLLEAVWAARAALSAKQRATMRRGLRSKLHCHVKALAEEQLEHMRCWRKDVASGLLAAGGGGAGAVRALRWRQQVEQRARRQQYWQRLAGCLVEELGPKAIVPDVPAQPAALQQHFAPSEPEPLLLVGAAAAGRLDVVQWLVGLGAPWSLPGEEAAADGDREELTALYAVARGGNGQLLEWALANGCPCPVAPGSGPCPVRAHVRALGLGVGLAPLRGGCTRVRERHGCGQGSFSLAHLWKMLGPCKPCAAHRVIPASALSGPVAHRGKRRSRAPPCLKLTPSGAVAHHCRAHACAAWLLLTCRVCCTYVCRRRAGFGCDRCTPRPRATATWPRCGCWCGCCRHPHCR
jgi:hypothetical protein